MTYAIAYVAVLVVFGTIDAVWLTTMGGVLYRPALGDILAPTLRVAPAIAFYLMYPVGIVVFAVLPGLDAARSRRNRPAAATLALVLAQPLQCRELFRRRPWRWQRPAAARPG